MRTLTLTILLLALALPVAAQRPVETDVYRTGAWGNPWDEASRELYLKGGLNLIGYSTSNADWAVQHGLKFIGYAGGTPPASAAAPFESNDGAKSGSVGIFTYVNFNAPSVQAWWQQSVPQQVQTVRHADQVEYWKVHNEFGYHEGRIWDYSPGSIARYQQWLQGRYADLATLNRRWGTSFAGFAAIQPPRVLPPDNLANWIEWRRFTCWSFGDYFHSTGDLIRAQVPGAKVSDNLYLVNPIEGWDTFALGRQTDYVAYDIYAIGRWDQLISTLDVARSAAAAADKPFLMMEYHAGPNNWIPVVRAEDLWIEANVALARECRALQWYMWRPAGGGREEGIHGMLDSKGRPTERYTAVRDTSEKLQRLAPLLKRARIRPAVAVLNAPDDVYLAYAQRGDVWATMGIPQTAGRLLDDARIPYEQVDPTWLDTHEPPYRAILVPGTRLLSDAQLAKLRSFAELGGTVVYFAGSAAYDELGHPRDPWFAAQGKPSGPWTVRPVNGQELAVETIGRGRIVRCGWEIPNRIGTGAERRQRSQAVAGLLAQQAGVQPAVVIAGDDQPWTLDAMPVRTDAATLLYLTVLGHEPRTNVSVTLPGMELTGHTAYVLQPRTSMVQKLAVTRQDGALKLTLPRLDPSAIVVLPTNWQPLVGIESPARMVPGTTVPVTVTVDNLGAETVDGNVQLDVPAAWTATPRLGGGAPGIRGVQQGEGGMVAFDVTVPATAAIDRFALDNPLTARVSFTRGRTGTLSATALPFIVPPLDVALTYHESLLNPWQELSPPILRWGWDSEVHVPPPPPVSVQASTPVAATITADRTLAGQTATLALEPAGQVSPAQVTLAAGARTLPVTVTLAQPGEYRLVVKAGDASFAAPFTAGVNTETVEASLAQAPAAGALAQFGIGARGASARRTPVTVPVKLTAEQTRSAEVIDAEGRPVPAVVGANQVVLAASVPVDQVRVYRIHTKGRTPAAVAMRTTSDPAGALTVGSDLYRVVFDTDLGLVRAIQDGQGKPLAPYRTGVVATLADGTVLAPDGRYAATALSTSGSPVEAKIEFGRPLGALAVNEAWTLQPERIAVAVSITNPSHGTVQLRRLDYELGFDPAALPGWRRVAPNGREETGQAPTGFTGAGGDKLLDWLDATGRGFGLTLGRCAFASKFQTGWQGVRQTPAATALGLMGGIRMDPGDEVIAEFELGPHAAPLPANEAKVPELVTVVSQPGA